MRLLWIVPLVALVWAQPVARGERQPHTLPEDAFVQAILLGAERSALPKELWEVICDRESTKRWWAYNESSGAVGLCQVKVIAAEQVLKRRVAPWELMDPYLSSEVGGRYLRWCERRFRDWGQAIDCYSRGPARVRERMFAWEYPKGDYTRGVLYEWYRLRRLTEFCQGARPCGKTRLST